MRSIAPVVSWLFLALLTGGVLGIHNLPDYYALRDHGVATSGTVVDITPRQHNTIVVEYRVAGRLYRAQDQVSAPNRPLSELKVGDEIVVYYVPSQLGTWSFGDPRARLANELTFVIGAALLLPSLVVGSFMLQLASNRTATRRRDALSGRSGRTGRGPEPP